MIYVYGDISGKPTDKVVVSAIYIGHESTWADVDRRWGAALREATVDHFHATDFYARPPRGAFEGWKHGSRRWRRADEAFTTVARKPLTGYATGMVTDAFPVLRAELVKTQAPHRISSLRLLCVTNCLNWVAYWVSRKALPEGERIQVLFEHEPGIGEVVSYFNYMKHRGALWTRGLLSLSTVSKHVHAAQVADLFAHQSWKALEADQGRPRPPNPSFARMLAGENLEVRLMTDEDVATSIPKVREFLDRHPRGYVSTRRRPRPRRPPNEA